MTDKYIKDLINKYFHHSNYLYYDTNPLAKKKKILELSLLDKKKMKSLDHYKSQSAERLKYEFHNRILAGKERMRKKLRREK